MPDWEAKFHPRLLPPLCVWGGASTAFSPDTADDVGKTLGLEISPVQTGKPHTGTLAAVLAGGEAGPLSALGSRKPSLTPELQAYQGAHPPAGRWKGMSLNYVGSRPAQEDPRAAVLGCCRAPGTESSSL